MTVNTLLSSTPTPFRRIIFGLDVGIASVGWCVLAPDDQVIVDLGVRTFDQAQDSGEWRGIKCTRRRLYRRAKRKRQMRALLVQHGLIEREDALDATPAISPWQLRVEGLERLLSPLEWARVLHHIIAHPGFYWSRKGEEQAELNADEAEQQDEADSADTEKKKGKDKEGKAKLKDAIQGVRAALLNDKTPAQYILETSPHVWRNKDGQYTRAIPREALAAELERLFERQQALGNPHANEALKTALLGTGDHKTGLLWARKAAISAEDLLGMVGTCTFEKDEKRAAKATYSAERHVLLTRILNLRLYDNGIERPPTDAERARLIELAYAKAVLTYADVRDALRELPGNTAIEIANVAIRSKKKKKAIKKAAKARAQQTHEQPGLPGIEAPPAPPPIPALSWSNDDLAARFVSLNAWRALRHAFAQAGRDATFAALAKDAHAGNPAMLDAIATAMTIHKEDDTLRAALADLGLASEDVDALLAASTTPFRAFHRLSLKALGKILPYMAKGLSYDAACAEAGYNHSAPNGADRQTLLPPIFVKNEDGEIIENPLIADRIPRNPQVLRSLNHAVKIINALVKEYGSPHAVHIELTRDLKKTEAERAEAFRRSRERDKKREALKKEFGEHVDLLRHELYEAQGGICPYSGAVIDRSRLNDKGYVEIDHILPLSRSFNDSQANKVLVMTEENREKKNRTPFEYFGHDPERWSRFVAYVHTHAEQLGRRRVLNLLNTTFAEQEQEFRDRALTDTGYIARFLKDFIEQYLAFAPDDAGETQGRCLTVNGSITGLLRWQWGLNPGRPKGDGEDAATGKDRSTHRHHAVDAAIIAACSPALIHRINTDAGKSEAQRRSLWEGIPDPTTGEIKNPKAYDRNRIRFTQPWPTFADELRERIHPRYGVLHYRRSRKKLRARMKAFGYSAEALRHVRPLFVSRSPTIKHAGALHKATILSGKPRGGIPGLYQRVALKDLTLKHFQHLDALEAALAAGKSVQEVQEIERKIALADPRRNLALYIALRNHLRDHDGEGKKAFGDKPFLRPNAKDADNRCNQVSHVRLRANNKPESCMKISDGYAPADSMLRVDVIQERTPKGTRYRLIPIYAHQVAHWQRTGQLPMKMIRIHKPESEWDTFDEAATITINGQPHPRYRFLFSLYPDDLVRIESDSGREMVGYYKSCNRYDATISLAPHDAAHSEAQVKFGIATARALEKLQVDVLGHVSRAKPETVRAGLA